ncbi:hypothetical protein ACHAXT_005485, partial [Thalassiosira profunda]
SPTKNPTESPTKNPTESPTTSSSPTASCVGSPDPGFCTCPAEYLSFNSITSVGVRLEDVSNGLTGFEDVTLPFSFNVLNVRDETSVRVRGTGVIRIGPDPNDSLRINNLGNNLDSTPGSAGGIYTKNNTDGSFTISYEGLQFSGGAGGVVNAQATLFEDGRVFLCYAPGSIPDTQNPRPRSRLFDDLNGANGPAYPNPLPGFDADGDWQDPNGTHPDGCACFFPGVPPASGSMSFAKMMVDEPVTLAAPDEPPVSAKPSPPADAAPPALGVWLLCLLLHLPLMVHLLR